MKIILFVLLFCSLSFGQYYFQNEPINNGTFTYSGEEDVFGNALPTFTYAPAVMLSKKGSNQIVTKMEETFFSVAADGVYDFIIYPEPIAKVYPQGLVKIANTTANIRVFWQDTNPQYLLKDDTLVTGMYLNSTGGYCVANWNDINYFDNQTQDTLGGSSGNDTHYQPAMAIVGDTAYVLWGMHTNAGRTNKFYFSNPSDTTGVDSLGSDYGGTYPMLYAYGDTIVTTMRGFSGTPSSGGQYFSSVVKWHKDDFPVPSTEWKIADMGNRFIAYFTVRTIYSGSNAYSVGLIRDQLNDAYGSGGQLLKNLYFSEWKNNLTDLYNLEGTLLNSFLPFDSLSVDSLKILETDTLICQIMDTYKYGDKVYIAYLYENIAKADTYDVWIGIVDLVGRTFTSTKTNFTDYVLITAPFKLYIRNNYIYLCGYDASNGSIVDYGINKIYKAPLSALSSFAEYKDTELVTWGHQLYNVGGTAMFLFMHDYIANPRNCLLRMYRRFN